MTILGRVRAVPDRLLHSWRRRALARHLARRQPPRSVVFICHGNICRSPFAAAVARSLFPASVKVSSAGMFGPGRSSPAPAIAAARRSGFDLAPHVSRALARQDLEADLVVVMDQAQRRHIVASVPSVAGRVLLLGDLDPRPIEKRAIRDPVEQSDEVYRASYDRIERCVHALAVALGFSGESPGR